MKLLARSLAMGSILAVQAAGSPQGHVLLAPEQVQWQDCPAALPAGAQCAVTEGDLTVPGALFAMLVKMPDGFKIPPHFHPGDEHLVVLAGTFHVGMGDEFRADQTRGMKPGSFIVMPKGTRHFARTTAQTVLHVYALGPWGITYVNPRDDPRNAPGAGGR